ncbi:MAG: dihydroxy-acid dehydratase [Conexivisphaerales archaeon]
MDHSSAVKDGINRAPHRSLLRADGLKDEDFKKPFIGIANSFTEVVPGHLHLRELVEHVKNGIKAEGGMPFEFNTIAVDDGIAMGHVGMKFSLPSRELIADSVEIMVKAHQFDALVTLSSCDKITPGMLMAAARLDIPTVIVTGGAMEAGMYNGRKVGLIDVFEAVGRYNSGEISEQEVYEIERVACPGAGSCSGLFTANTMAILVEAMGLALPYGGTALATSEQRKNIAFESGHAVVRLFREGATARRFMTKDAFRNAIAVDMALGGSTNTILHLLAAANEAEVNLTLDDFDEIGHNVPHIAPIYPGGPYMIEDLHEAGGVPAIMSSIKDKLKLDLPTVSGITVGEIIKNATISNHEIIRNESNPVHKIGGITILKGNLAPNGAVIKVGALKENYRFKGKAVAFDSEEEAFKAVVGEKVLPGHVIVIRYEGPRGGPGMREMLDITSAVVGMRIDDKVALITDGRFSGGTRGPAVGHISPEAWDCGPIALVNDDDIIEIDVPNRKLNLEVTEQELKIRKERWVRPKIKTDSPVLKRYSYLVTSSDKGCVMRKDFYG